MKAVRWDQLSQAPIINAAEFCRSFLKLPANNKGWLGVIFGNCACSIQVASKRLTVVVPRSRAFSSCDGKDKKS